MKVTYYFKKGRHVPKWTWNRLWPFIKHVSFDKWYKFSPSCVYPRKAVTYTGWNKLGGISGLFVHRRSARLVWQPEFDSRGLIRLSAYVYTGEKQDTIKVKCCGLYWNTTKWKAIHLTTIRWDQAFEVKISYVNNGWKFELYIPSQGYVKKHIKAKKPMLPFFRTFAYFGGRSASPNDMQIVEGDYYAEVEEGK